MTMSRIPYVGMLVVIGVLLLIPLSVAGDEQEGQDERQALDKMPELVSQKAPVYPERALREQAEGKVFLDLRISTEGLVDSIEVKQGVDGYPELADAAEAAAREWRFKPGEIKGDPVVAWVTVPVMFKLDKEKADSCE